MIKKFLALFLIILLQSNFSFAFAKSIKVTALQVFDSLNPPKNFKVKLDENLNLSEEKTLYKNYILSGYIYTVIPPKRLKQDASFIFIPTEYTDFFNNIYPLNNVVCKYTTKFELKDFTINSALILGFGAVPGLLAAAGYYAAEGAIKNQDGNRFKSSTTEAYEKSYLSLGEKGNNLHIDKNQNFLLNIVVIKNQEPNYEITPVN